MNILFISSGNKKDGISPIIKNQGESIVALGHRVSYFTIEGKGFKGYIRNIFILKNYLKNNFFDIIHAHYSLSGFVASLAGAKPIVVSLMGSDVKSNRFFKCIIKSFAFLFWKSIIVKSKDMKDSLNLSKAQIIPNGVSFERFKPIEKAQSLEMVKWSIEKKNILFAADPRRKEKNFELAVQAFDLLENQKLELNTLVDVPNELIPYYLNAAEVVLLTSLWEGSPNIIKEAMACNIPVVSTDVGDVKEIIGDISGCFVTTFDSEDVALKIKLALGFAEEAGRTEGRLRMTKLNLSSEIIARRLTDIYERNILKNKGRE
ncbi:MAG: glycosyltransferase family 4 protein [Bacteroidota bacterium]